MVSSYIHENVLCMRTLATISVTPGVGSRREMKDHILDASVSVPFSKVKDKVNQSRCSTLPAAQR